MAGWMLRRPSASNQGDQALQGLQQGGDLWGGVVHDGEVQSPGEMPPPHNFVTDPATGMPVDPVQGMYGKSLALTNPQWAPWFDMVDRAAPGGVSGIGNSRTNPSVQPGQNDYSTWGLPAGYGEDQFNQEAQQYVASQGDQKPGFMQTPGGGNANLLPDVKQRLINAMRGLQKART